MRKSTIALLLAAAFAPAALANPTGAQVVNGAALLSNPNASTLQITNTPGTIINWQGFSIAAGETTRFVQLNAASAVLNRVVSGNPSSILGNLQSNGRVFLINPNGIVFGGSAVVDVAGLIASTRDISNANFLAGNLRFEGASNGTITVESGAQILTTTQGPGGQVWLFAKDVTQQAGSTITAPQGQVVLAAGSAVQVATASLGNMTFNVTTSGNDTVNSLGTIAAERGAVGLFGDFVNHRGAINAGTGGTIEMNATRDLKIQGASTTNAPDGVITLRGGQLLEVEHDSSITADGPNGRLSFESNDIRVFPSENTHAIGGSVTFNQYAASEYVGAGWTTAADMAGMGGATTLAFRNPDGSYTVRIFMMEGLIDTTFHVVDIQFDKNGMPVSSSINPTRELRPTGPYYTAWEPLNPQYAKWLRFGLTDAPYSEREARRLPMAGGGWVEPAWNQLRIIGPSGNVIATRPYELLGANGGQSVPMPDGTILLRPGDDGPLVHVLSRNGANTGVVVAVPRRESGEDSPPPIFPTADGGFTAVRRGENNVPVSVQTEAQHFTKKVVPYAPANSLTGAGGAASRFATAPGVTPQVVASVELNTPLTVPNTPLTTPQTPPPVVSGEGGGGVIFGGVSGCNSAVCNEAERDARAVDALILADANRAELRLALAATDALRASQPGGPAASVDPFSSAETAVLALQRAAGRQQDVTAANAVAVLMVDNGELRRLVQGRFDEMTPAQRLDAIERWAQAESLEQRLGDGSNRDPNQISLVGAVLNMNDEERAAFGSAMAARQARGEL